MEQLTTLTDPTLRSLIGKATWGVDETERYKYKVTACTNGYFRVVKYDSGVRVGRTGRRFKDMEVRPVVLDNLTFSDEAKAAERAVEHDNKMTAMWNDYACSQTETQQEYEEFMNTVTGKKRSKRSFRQDNISRSRRNIMELVANNSHLWKSFVTLTFKENVTDLKEAGKQFHIWMTQLNRALGRKVQYIGLTERQKRGAIHYHLLMDCVCGTDFPARPAKRLWSPSEKKWTELVYYDLPYWNAGFSSAFDLTTADDDFRVEKYITKYMTKSVEEGGYSLVRSRDLKKPVSFYTNNDEAVAGAVTAVKEADQEDKVYRCAKPDLSKITKEPEKWSSYIQGYTEHNIVVPVSDIDALYNILISPLQGTELCNVLKKNRITYNTRRKPHNKGINDKE